MEATLHQQLAAHEQVPLYGIFLDPRKAFDAMDRGWCVQILEDAGFGVGTKALRLIRTFWDKAILVCRASGCVLPFRWLFIAVDTDTPPSSRRDIVGQSKTAFPPAARCYPTYSCLTVRIDIPPLTKYRNLSLQI